jgi:DNA-binding transcriptional MerR regulator
MIDYLGREELVLPTGSTTRVRGRRRSFSFGDVVTLRIIRRLLDSGIEIRRLKAQLRDLKGRLSALTPDDLPFRYLVTDGCHLYFETDKGHLETVGVGQLAFAFLIDLQQPRQEVLEAAIDKYGGWLEAQAA